MATWIRRKNTSPHKDPVIDDILRELEKDEELQNDEEFRAYIDGLETDILANRQSMKQKGMSHQQQAKLRLEYPDSPVLAAVREIGPGKYPMGEQPKYLGGPTHITFTQEQSDKIHTLFKKYPKHWEIEASIGTFKDKFYPGLSSRTSYKEFKDRMMKMTREHGGTMDVSSDTYTVEIGIDLRKGKSEYAPKGAQSRNEISESPIPEFTTSEKMIFSFL